MSSLQEPALEMWRPWSETLRAARTVWTWWWRIRATAFIAAPTGPPRPARTQLTSPSEGWGSPRAPLMSMWGLVSRFNFSASVNCSNGLKHANHDPTWTHHNTCHHAWMCVFSPAGPACMPGACRATGRGLQPSGMRVKQVGDFKIDTRNAGSGDLKVVVKGPSEYSSLNKENLIQSHIDSWEL